MSKNMFLISGIGMGKREYSRIFSILHSSKVVDLCRVTALKNVTPHIDIVLLFLHFLVFWDCRFQDLFSNRVALKPGLGGVRDVASAIISHEQTQSNRVCYFQNLDAVFPKDPLSDYLIQKF